MGWMRDVATYARALGCGDQCLSIALRLRGLVLRRYVDRLWLVTIFGSLVRGGFGPLSDVDIGVGLIRAEDALDVVSDLVTDVATELGVVEDKVDIVVLSDDLPIRLMYDAIVAGLPIYVGDWGRYINEWVRVFSEYADFQVFLSKHRFHERYLRSLREGVHGQDK